MYEYEDGELPDEPYDICDGYCEGCDENDWCEFSEYHGFDEDYE